MIKNLTLCITILALHSNLYSMYDYNPDSLKALTQPLFNAEKIPAPLAHTIAKEIVKHVQHKDNRFKDMLLDAAQEEHVITELAKNIVETIDHYKTNQDPQMTHDDKLDLTDIAIYNKALMLLQNEQKSLFNQSAELSSQGETDSNQSFSMSTAQPDEALTKGSVEQQITRLHEITNETITAINHMPKPGSFNASVYVDEQQYYETIAEKMYDLAETAKPIMELYLKNYALFIENVPTFFQRNPQEQLYLKQEFFDLVTTTQLLLSVAFMIKEQNSLTYKNLFYTIQESAADNVKTEETALLFYSSIEYAKNQLKKRYALLAPAKKLIDTAMTITPMLAQVMQCTKKLQEYQRSLDLKPVTKEYELLVTTIENVETYHKDNRDQTWPDEITRLEQKLAREKEKIDAFLQKYSEQKKIAAKKESESLKEEMLLFQKELQNQDHIQKLQDQLDALQNAHQDFVQELTMSSDELLQFGSALHNLQTNDPISQTSLACKMLLDSETIKKRTILAQQLHDEIRIILLEQKISDLKSKQIYDSITSHLESNPTLNTFHKDKALLADHQKALQKIYKNIQNKIEQLQIYFEIIEETLQSFEDQRKNLKKLLEQKATQADRPHYNRIKQIEINLLQLKEHIDYLYIYKQLLAHYVSEINLAEQQYMQKAKSLEQQIDQSIKKQKDLEQQKQHDEERAKNNAATTIQKFGRSYIAQKEINNTKQEKAKQQATQTLHDQQAAPLMLELEKKEEEILELLNKAITEQTMMQEKTAIATSDMQAYIAELEKNIEDLKALEQEEQNLYKNINTKEEQNLDAFNKLQAKRVALRASLKDLRQTKQLFKELTELYKKIGFARPLEYLKEAIQQYKDLAERYVQTKHGNKNITHFTEFKTFLKNIIEEFNAALEKTKAQYHVIESTYKALLEKEKLAESLDEQEKEVFRLYQNGLKKAQEKNSADLFKNLAGAGLQDETVDLSQAYNFNPLDPSIEEQEQYDTSIRQAKQKMLESLKFADQQAAQEALERQEKKMQGLKSKQDKKSKEQKKIDELTAQLAQKQAAEREEKLRQKQLKQDFENFEKEKMQHLQNLEKISDEMLQAYHELFASSVSATAQKQQEETVQHYQADIKKQATELEQILVEKKAEFQRHLQAQQDDIKRIVLESEQSIESTKEQAQQIIMQKEKDSSSKIAELEKQLLKTQQEALLEQEALVKARQEDNQKAEALAQKQKKDLENTISQLQEQIIQQKQEKEVIIHQAAEDLLKAQQNAFATQQAEIKKIEQDAAQKITELQNSLKAAQQDADLQKQALQDKLEQQKQINQTTAQEIKAQRDQAVQEAQAKEAIAANRIAEIQTELETVQQQKESAQKAHQVLEEQQKQAQLTYQKDIQNLQQELTNKELQAQQTLDSAQKSIHQLKKNLAFMQQKQQEKKQKAMEKLKQKQAELEQVKKDKTVTKKQLQAQKERLTKEIESLTKQAQDQEELAKQEISAMQTKLYAQEEEVTKAVRENEKLKQQQEQEVIAYQKTLDQQAKEYALDQEKQKVAFEDQLQKQQQEIDRIKQESEQLLQKTIKQAQDKIAQQEQKAAQDIAQLEELLQKTKQVATEQQTLLKQAHEQDNQKAQQQAEQKEVEAQKRIEQLQKQMMQVTQEKQEVIAQAKQDIAKAQQAALKDQQDAIKKIELEALQKIEQLHKDLALAEKNAELQKQSLLEKLEDQKQTNQNTSQQLKTQRDQAAQEAQAKDVIAQRQITQIKAELKAIEQEKEIAQKTAYDLEQQKKQADIAHKKEIELLKKDHAQKERFAQETQDAAQQAIEQLKQNLAQMQQKEQARKAQAQLDLEKKQADLELALQDKKITKEQLSSEIKNLKKVAQEQELSASQKISDMQTQLNRMQQEKEQSQKTYESQIDQLKKEHKTAVEKLKTEYQLQQDEMKRAQQEAEQKMRASQKEAQQKIAQQEQEALEKITTLNQRLLNAQQDFLQQELAHKSALEQQDLQAQQMAQNKEVAAKDRIDKLMMQIRQTEKEKEELSIKAQNDMFKQQQEALATQKEAMQKIEQLTHQKSIQYEKLLQEAQETALAEKSVLEKALEKQRSTHEQENILLKQELATAVQDAQHKEHLAQEKAKQLQEQLDDIQQQNELFALAVQELTQQQLQAQQDHQLDIKRLVDDQKAFEAKRMKQLEKQLLDARTKLEKEYAELHKQTNSTPKQAKFVDENKKLLITYALELAEYLLQRQATKKLAEQALELALLV